jgi:hypothetical protein
MPARRSTSNVRDESLRRHSPFFRHSDTASAVIVVALISWVVTPLFDGFTCFVLAGLAASGALAVTSLALSEEFTMETSARTGVACFYVIGVDDREGSTHATTTPVRAAMGRSGSFEDC